MVDPVTEPVQVVALKLCYHYTVDTSSAVAFLTCYLLFIADDEVTCMFHFSVTSRTRRDSLYVYHQDVDLSSELTARSGPRREGKLLATHVQRGCGLGG